MISLYHTSINNAMSRRGINTSIGAGAFQGCFSLTSIEIPDSVTSIGVGAFQSCSNLISIEIPNSVTSIAVGAFQNCPNLIMTVAEGSYAQKYAFRNNLDFGNEFDYKARNGKVTIIGYAGSDENLIIPQELVGSTVVSIEDFTFSGNESLITIEIPDSVTSIGERAFEGCENLTLVIEEGSYAHEYALAHDIDFVLE